MKLHKAKETNLSKPKGDKMNKYLITNHPTKETTIVQANSAQEAAQKTGFRIKEKALTDIGHPKLSGMTIDEAIYYIDTRAKDLEFRGYDRSALALRLGIDSLNRLKQLRLNPNRHPSLLLPGETKDLIL